jgi:L-asparagine transporter-like permease
MNQKFKSVVLYCLWIFLALFISAGVMFAVGGEYAGFLWLGIFVSIMIYPTKKLLKNFKSNSSDDNTAKSAKLKISGYGYFIIIVAVGVVIAFFENIVIGFLSLFVGSFLIALVYFIKNPDKARLVSAASNGLQGRDIDDNRSRVPCLNCGHEVYGMWSHNNPCVKLGKKCIDPKKLSQ